MIPAHGSPRAIRQSPRHSPLQTTTVGDGFRSCVRTYGPRQYPVHGGIETSLTPFTMLTGGLGQFPRCLPLRPRWLGFAINTAVYAAMLGVPLLLLPMLRRAWRRKQQRCPNCGYEIGPGGQSRCPECGEGVRREGRIGE